MATDHLPSWLRRALPSASFWARRAAIHTGFVLVVAVVAQLLLEASRTGWDLRYVLELLSRDFSVVAISALVLSLVVGLVLAVSGRLWFTAALVLGATTLLGVASNAKFAARHEPIYPRDLPMLAEPRFLLEMVEPSLVWLTLLGLVAVVAFSWALSRPFHTVLRRLATSDRGARSTGIGLRVLSVGLLVLLLAGLSGFNHGDNAWRATYEDAGARWRKASQASNYDENGFVGGFLYNLDTPAMATPPRYSRTTMERIAAKYTALVEREYADRDPAALRDVNVVFVLSESFSDPTRLAGMRLAEDPIPRTRRLMERLPHGWMLAQKSGGGTSGVEFESLTGMSLALFDPVLDTPYQMLVPKYDTFPSAVEMFNRMGHATVGLHSFTPRLYERSRVYPILGFSDFISQGHMRHQHRIEDNPYISDKSTFREALGVLESRREPVFLNIVTMQNHFPYKGEYDDPVTVSGLEPDGTEAVGQYARGLSHSDQAIERFIARVGRSDEKTIVVFYGDHLPAAIPEEVHAANPARLSRETPFFLYRNFGGSRPQRLPTTGAPNFMAHVFDLAGATPPPYYALLREVEKRIPAMQHGLMIGPDDQVVRHDQLPADTLEVLEDYRLVQYDLAAGRRYAERMLYADAGLRASGSGE